MKKHIVFDLDDTLTNSLQLNRQIFIETVVESFKDFFSQDHENKVQVLEKIHVQMRGESMIDHFKKAIKEFDLNTISPMELLKKNESLQQKRANRIGVFDSLFSLLKRLKKENKVLSVCSNREIKSLNQVLTANKIDDYFHNIISCSEAGYEKPDPYCLIELIKNTPHIKKEETVYLGDSNVDAQFAKGAGVDFLMVNNYSENKNLDRLTKSLFATISL